VRELFVPDTQYGGVMEEIAGKFVWFTQTAVVVGMCVAFWVGVATVAAKLFGLI
jgi:hypothetical protein